VTGLGSLSRRLAQLSSIDSAAMSDPQHNDERFSVLNPRDHAIVADPVSRKFAEAVALQRLTDRTRVIERSDPIAKEAENARDELWSLSSSRAATRSNSILHAMTLDKVAQRNRPAAAFPQILEAAFGEIDVFKLVKVVENRLSRIKALRASGAPSELGESGLDFRRKAKSKHDASNLQYMYSTPGSGAMNLPGAAQPCLGKRGVISAAERLARQIRKTLMDERR
jgi:hypothetical protein